VTRVQEEVAQEHQILVLEVVVVAIPLMVETQVVIPQEVVATVGHGTP
jgi:hypothetical protein